jgi:hypothetical protein
MRKRLKLNSDGSYSDSKNSKRGYDDACGGVRWSLHLSGVCGLESGDRFCVGVNDRNLAAVVVKMFSHLIFFIKAVCRFCAFNAICEDIAAVNCVTFQHKKVSFSSVLIRSYARRE